MAVLVTGSAGFIGFHLARKLLEQGETVIGYDGFTPYYDVQLKRDRTAILQAYGGFSLIEAQLEDTDRLLNVVAESRPEVVVHLAAQAGVRYSIENPGAYISSNLSGTFKLLEALRAHPPKHLLFASTSSIYGSNEEQPFRERHRTDFPVSLYAATKRGCESMSHSYAHLYGIPTTCFRFFTVYGPWGRPDMALFKFVRSIERDEPIDVYGNGEMYRDFTYIDDLVEAILLLVDRAPVPGQPVSEDDSLSPTAPWRAVNLAGGAPQSLGSFIETIENRLGRPAKRNLMPMQPGDVVATHADPTLLRDMTGYTPGTPLSEGVDAFVTWFEEYYSIER